jgi:CBS-domain-containing membrane protein
LFFLFFTSPFLHFTVLLVITFAGAGGDGEARLPGPLKVALAVALTGGALRVLRAAHPPAGATTIIVASGLLATVHDMAFLLIGVLLLTIAAWCLNHLLGVPAPRWTAH